MRTATMLCVASALIVCFAAARAWDDKAPWATVTFPPETLLRIATPDGLYVIGKERTCFVDAHLSPECPFSPQAIDRLVSADWNPEGKCAHLAVAFAASVGPILFRAKGPEHLFTFPSGDHAVKLTSDGVEIVAPCEGAQGPGCARIIRTDCDGKTIETRRWWPLWVHPSAFIVRIHRIHDRLWFLWSPNGRADPAQNRWLDEDTRAAGDRIPMIDQRDNSSASLSPVDLNGSSTRNFVTNDGRVIPIAGELKDLRVGASGVLEPVPDGWNAGGIERFPMGGVVLERKGDRMRALDANHQRVDGALPWRKTFSLPMALMLVWLLLVLPTVVPLALRLLRVRRIERALESAVVGTLRLSSGTKLSVRAERASVSGGEAWLQVDGFPDVPLPPTLGALTRVLDDGDQAFVTGTLKRTDAAGDGPMREAEQVTLVASEAGLYIGAGDLAHFREHRPGSLVHRIPAALVFLCFFQLGAAIVAAAALARAG